jgi:hypothetical protein
VILAIRDEIPIEIDVVFVGASKPGHSEWIQNVREDQCSSVCQDRQAVEELKLDCGTRETLHTVDAGGVEESVAWRFSSNPADVDTESISGRAAGGQLQGVEPTTHSLQLSAKLRFCFFVGL